MLFLLLNTLHDLVGPRRNLMLENAVLRHQIDVLQRNSGRPSLRWRDRAFWDVLCSIWPNWRKSLYIVQPDTVIRWHRQGFRFYWRWKSRYRWPGRPKVSREVRNLIRDRDGIYGFDFTRRVASLGIEQIQTARRSPWQNPYVERVIGSIRRECLDHVIVFDERHLSRVLREYVDCYHRSRTHLGLEKDCLMSRHVEPAVMGDIQSESILGGLHHRYTRRAATI